MLNLIMLSVTFIYCYAERHSAACRHAECRYGKCRSALQQIFSLHFPHFLFPSISLHIWRAKKIAHTDINRPVGAKDIAIFFPGLV
jgi:hypothetical protein